MLVNGQYGIEVGTQNQYRTVNNIKKPLIFAINRLDSDTADYDNVLNQLRETFGNKVIPVQFPVSTGAGFKSIVDVMMMKQLNYDGDSGKATVTDIDPAYQDRAEELNMALIEMAAEGVRFPVSVL